MSGDKKEELERAALVQRHQLDRGSARVGELEGVLSRLSDENRRQSATLDDMEAYLRGLRGLSEADARRLPLVAHDSRALSELTAELSYLAPLPLLGVEEGEGWEQTYTRVEAYIGEHDLDLETPPLTQLLSPAHIARLTGDFDREFGDISWSKMDWFIVGFASTVATLVDIALVRIPKDASFLGKEYNGSPITKKLDVWSKEIDSGSSDNPFFRWLGELQRSLEKWAKVSYDTSINKPGAPRVEGLRPALHRFMSPGHDPVLGFIVGVIDQLLGQCTLIDANGRLVFLDTAAGMGFSPEKLLNAFIKVAAHVLSDIPTPAGIQPPGFTLLQLITARSPFTLEEGGERVDLNHVARWMYAQGYTLEHFTTMSIVPTLIELIVRLYYRVAYFPTSPVFPEYHTGHRAKLTSLLAVAHTLSAAGNVLKAGLYGWNPSALNWATWTRLPRALFATMKADRERERAIQDSLDARIVILWSRSSP